MQQLIVVGLEEVKRADTPSLILARLFQVSGEFVKSGAVVNRTEGVPITLIGFLETSQRRCISATPRRMIRHQVILRAAFRGPVGFEDFRVLGERFDAKQVAPRGAGFAVTFQGIAVNAVF